MTSLKERIRIEAGRRFETPRDANDKYAAACVLRAIAQRGSGPLPRWIRWQGEAWGVL